MAARGGARTQRGMHEEEDPILCSTRQRDDQFRHENRGLPRFTQSHGNSEWYARKTPGCRLPQLAQLHLGCDLAPATALLFLQSALRNQCLATNHYTSSQIPHRHHPPQEHPCCGVHGPGSTGWAGGRATKAPPHAQYLAHTLTHTRNTHTSHHKPRTRPRAYIGRTRSARPRCSRARSRAQRASGG